MSQFYKSIMRLVVLVIFLVHGIGVSYAQEEELEEGEKKEVHLKHKLSLYTGYSWIPEGRNSSTNEKETILAPSLGFSYEYWFTDKWAIGTYNDLQVINVQIEKKDGEFLERENAVAFTLGATYQVLPKMTISLGGGIEADANETLGIIRLGGEYVLLEKNEWELSASLTIIHKDIYDIVGFGFVLGRKF